VRSHCNFCRIFGNLLSYLVVQTHLQSIKEIEKKRGIRNINTWQLRILLKISIRYKKENQ
jgi:hypothetical protein